MAGDNANFWEDIELIIDPDPFFTSCHIPSMKKKARSYNPLKPKSPFKWIFVDIIPETAPKLLISDTTFSNYLLIFMPTLKSQKFMAWRKLPHKK